MLWKWHHVSLASISAAAVPLLILLAEHSLPPFLASLFISGMVILLRHRTNIERLHNGTESRFRA